MLRITTIISCLLVTTSTGFFDLFGRGARVITGSPCSENQVIRSLRVHWNETIEFECGPVPCGEFGTHCVDSQIQCRAENDYFVSRMKATPNNDSVLLRCCHLQTTKKTIYVGTEEIFFSNYNGGKVARNNRYDKNGGVEYNFIGNVRAEPSGVRIWVYRIMCDKKKPTTTTTAVPVTTTSPVIEEKMEEEASGEKELANEAEVAPKEEETVQASGEKLTNEV